MLVITLDSVEIMWKNGNKSKLVLLFSFINTQNVFSLGENMSRFGLVFIV